MAGWIMPADSSRFQEPGRSVIDGVQLPGAGDTLQLVLASVGEGEPRAHNEVADSAGYQHFAGPGLGRHASTDMHGDTTHIRTAELALAGV